MKVEFERKDIEAFLIARAKELGVADANHVEWPNYYMHCAVVSNLPHRDPVTLEPIDVIDVAKAAA